MKSLGFLIVGITCFFMAFFPFEDLIRIDEEGKKFIPAKAKENDLIFPLMPVVPEQHFEDGPRRYCPECNKYRIGRMCPKCECSTVSVEEAPV